MDCKCGMTPCKCDGNCGGANKCTPMMPMSPMTKMNPTPVRSIGFQEAITIANQPKNN